MSVAFLALLTLVILDAALDATCIGRMVMHTQLVTAMLAGSTIWIVLWVIVTISFGRVYCSSVCPLGTVQDAASRCGIWCRKGSKKWYRFAPAQNALRYPIPIIVALAFFLGFMSVLRFTDPYSIYSHVVLAIARPGAIAFGSAFVAGVLMLAVGAVAAFKGRIVCNTVCPIGGLLALLGRTPIFRVDINTDKCIHCGKCEQVCKAQCIDLRTCVVDNSRCVMCLDCTAVCPNDAITVRRGRYRLSTPMMQPTMQHVGGEPVAVESRAIEETVPQTDQDISHTRTNKIHENL